MDTRSAVTAIGLDDIIACYITACEAGETPDEQEVLERHPQYEQQLRGFFQDYRLLLEHLPDSDSPPHLGDDYEILELIDGGGQALVYKAHQKSLNKVVAIKLQRRLSAHSDPEGIRREAQRAARLRHPHIVPVHHVAEHDGHRFCVMDFIEGQNLAKRIGSGPLPSAEAASIVKTIAEAIHYAHQREILHCDLKPRNILLDEDGKPYVADFGLAKRLGEGGRSFSSSIVGGTAGYMSPEQSRGGELTTATDVYGLGAILYALLTARDPFRGETLHDTLKLVREADPLPPRRYNPQVDQDLEAICLKCLRKNADERYASAHALVRDLERCLRRQQTTARAWSSRERAAGWCRRHPVLAGSMIIVTLASMLTAVIALSIEQARRQKQLEGALQSNTSVAKALANTALLQLRDWARIVEVASADATLPELLRKSDRAGLQRYVESVCKGAPGVCASCGIRNLEGISVARTGDGTPDFSTATSSQRDYFLSALKHGGASGQPSVHISKVYVSTVDKLHKFAISAPVRNRSGGVVGVILMSVTTDAALGLVKFPDAHRIVALIAPLDNFDAGTSSIDPSARHVVLFHPAYPHGGPAVEFPYRNLMAAFPKPIHTQELYDSNYTLRPIANYEDPVAASFPEYQGQWIAGFAPVGNAGFFVIVQQRVDDALSVDPFVSWNLAAGIALAIVLILAIAAAFLGRYR